MAKKYSDEQTAVVRAFIDKYKGAEIPRADFEVLVTKLNEDSEETFSLKSVASKIRFMEGKIEATKPKAKVFTEADEKVILRMTKNPNKLPFLEEIADKLGKTPSQVRGKLVSMKIKGIKKRDIKAPAPKLFTEEHENIIRKMTSDPANMPFIEDVAEKLGIEVNKVRGKIASMKIKGVLSKNTKAPRAKIYTDELKAELTELIKTKTIEEIAELKKLNFAGLRSVLGKMGLIEKKAKQVYWTDERVAQLQDLINEGKDYKEIGEIMKKNPLVIAKKVKQLQAPVEELVTEEVGG